MKPSIFIITRPIEERSFWIPNQRALRLWALVLSPFHLHPFFLPFLSVFLSFFPFFPFEREKNTLWYTCCLAASAISPLKAKCSEKAGLRPGFISEDVLLSWVGPGRVVGLKKEGPYLGSALAKDRESITWIKMMIQIFLWETNSICFSWKMIV